MNSQYNHRASSLTALTLCVSLGIFDAQSFASNAQLNNAVIETDQEDSRPKKRTPLEQLNHIIKLRVMTRERLANPVKNHASSSTSNNHPHPMRSLPSLFGSLPQQHWESLKENESPYSKKLREKKPFKEVEDPEIARAIKLSLQSQTEHPLTLPSDAYSEEDEDFKRAIELSKLSEEQFQKVTTQPESREPGTQSKLTFKVNPHDHPVLEKVPLTEEWQKFDSESINNEFGILVGKLKKDNNDLLVRTITPKGPYTITKALPFDGLPNQIQVGATLGGGDCAFFAYGNKSSRATFISRSIAAILQDTSSASHLDRSAHALIHQSFTFDLMQRALLDESGNFLRSIGIDQSYEELFKDGPEKAPVPSAALANFIYHTYGIELECLSVHALKALAIMDGVNLCIWQPSNTERSIKSTSSLLPPVELVNYHWDSKAKQTIHMHFDGQGHFSAAFTINNQELLKKTQKKSLMSFALETMLTQKGIGVQEYAQYTPLMKMLYWILCA